MGNTQNEFRTTRIKKQRRWPQPAMQRRRVYQPLEREAGWAIAEVQLSPVAAAEARQHQNLPAISGRQRQPSSAACQHLVQQGAVVNYFEAHKLLDEVRDGHNHTFDDITKALELVGDLDQDLCTDGVSCWRPGPETGKTGLPGATVFRIGAGFSRHHSDDSPKN